MAIFQNDLLSHMIFVALIRVDRCREKRIKVRIYHMNTFAEKNVYVAL